MFIVSQQAIKCYLLTAFIAVSAIGHGLHYLPGVAQHGIDPDGIGHSTCAHGCQHSQRVASEESGDQDHHDSSDDCSVCRVLAQSIDVCEPIEPLTATFFQFFAPLADSSRLALFVGDCRSRGPPVAGELSI